MLPFSILMKIVVIPNKHFLICLTNNCAILLVFVYNFLLVLLQQRLLLQKCSHILETKAVAEAIRLTDSLRFTWIRNFWCVRFINIIKYYYKYYSLNQHLWILKVASWNCRQEVISDLIDTLLQNMSDLHLKFSIPNFGISVQDN